MFENLDVNFLFRRFLEPWYNSEVRKARGHVGIKPDVERWAAPGTSAAAAMPISEEGQKLVREQIDGMLEAAIKDWELQYGLKGSPDLTWIERFDAYLDAARLKKLVRDSDPRAFTNPYVVTGCEFGVILGTILISMNPRLAWLYDWPYWESGIYDANTGLRIHVFHWSFKRLSSYGLNDGYRLKIIAALNLLDGRVNTRETAPGVK